MRSPNPHLSLILCSMMFSSLGAADVALTLKKDTTTTASGFPTEFKYSYDKDGKPVTSATEVTMNTNYYWAEGTDKTLSLVAPSSSGSTNNVAVAVFSATGSDDNLLLENFNYISAGPTITTKGQNDTYFAILNGPVPYKSFTLNGANIYSGSNLFIGPLSSTVSTSTAESQAADSATTNGNSTTGGFATVYLKGEINVKANSTDSSDTTTGTAQKGASITFRSEYSGAVYNLKSGATLNLTSTGDKVSKVSFIAGLSSSKTTADSAVATTTAGDSTTTSGKVLTNQVMLNEGTINITNTTANTTVGTDSEETNRILFDGVSLQNEGTINLKNATLHFKDADLLVQDSSSTAGTIAVAATAGQKSSLTTTTLGTSSSVTNTSTIFYENSSSSTTRDFKIASQTITVSGVAASDASSGDTELFGAKLVIGMKKATASTGTAEATAVDNTAASTPTDTLILTGTSSAALGITVGASSNNDKNTSLVFGDSTNKIKVSIGNNASITVQSGATLDLKTGISDGKSITLSDTVSSGSGAVAAAVPAAAAAASSSVNTSSILQFANNGTITLTANTTSDTTDYTTLDATGKKVILTEYAVTKTTCAIGSSSCGTSITDASNIPKNATLTTTTVTEAGTLALTGGRSQIKADVAYNFGNLTIASGATLDLSKITKMQDGSTAVSTSASSVSVQSSDSTISATTAIGFVNAGVVTSNGGVIDTRTDFTKDWFNGSKTTTTATQQDNAASTTNGNTKTLIITQAKQAKATNDTANSGIEKGTASAGSDAKAASDTTATTATTSYLEEKVAWAANKNNEVRAQFVAASGTTIIRASAVQNQGLTSISSGASLNLSCVGTGYCYNGGYWNDADSTSKIVNPPTTSASETSGTSYTLQTAQNIKWDNATAGNSGGEIRLNGGSLSVIDTYKYQDSSNNNADVKGYIYHSLTISKGTLSAYGGSSSYIYTGAGNSSTGDHYLTLDSTNIVLSGDSKLYVISQNKSDSNADLTWKIPASSSTGASIVSTGGGSSSSTASNANTTGGEFRMYIGDSDYTKNSRGLYVLSKDSSGNLSAGTLNIQDASTTTNANTVASTGTATLTNKPTFTVDLSNLSGKNTILLDKQYNFIVAKEITKGNGTTAKITASDFIMQLYFGKGAKVTSSGDTPVTSDGEYGKADATSCSYDPKFCLNAGDTKPSGSTSASSGTIVIDSTNKEGVVVTDTTTSVSGITGSTQWPNSSSSSSSETKETSSSTTVYSDFVTFNKVYQEGTGNCNITGDLSGCAIIGFSAVKSQTLASNGITSVFDSIKERADQLSSTTNTVVTQSAQGVKMIESSNSNAVTILQGIIDTDGTSSSSVLLRLQAMQYTGDLGQASSVASDVNTVNNVFEMVASEGSRDLELANRIHMGSTLSTSSRLALRSNPYNQSFAYAIASLKDKKLASSYYNYTDRFDYDSNLWGQLIGGFGGYYSNGYSALGGFTVGYDRALSRILLGTYATYAYTYSVLNSYNNDSNAGSVKNSNNIELGGYMRAYIDAHEIDVIVSETYGYNNLSINGDNLVNQKMDFSNFTTYLTSRYGYVLPVNPSSGFYVKPFAELNLLYQYNTQGKGRGEVAIVKDGQHAIDFNIGAFVEFRKYTDDKRFFYITPGIQQDFFVYNSTGQIYFAQSTSNSISYSVDNNYRTYLTVLGGGEIGIRDNLSITFGVGAKISWDRYFLNANVGMKYKFNTQ